MITFEQWWAKNSPMYSTKEELALARKVWNAAVNTCAAEADAVGDASPDHEYSHLWIDAIDHAVNNIHGRITKE